MSSLPFSPAGGVPLKVPEVASNFSHFGSGEPSARVALMVMIASLSLCANTPDGNLKLDAASVPSRWSATGLNTRRPPVSDDAPLVPTLTIQDWLAAMGARLGTPT